ncbi:hypothetical protein, partial [Comamonas testosteroni]|uniref:hypothetical protein n=1 Tax=Comamonas testosteroni TaxID=285 RepID=UPI001E44F6BB
LPIQEQLGAAGTIQEGENQELIHTVSLPGLQKGWIKIRWKCRLRVAWKLTISQLNRPVFPR